MVAISWQRPNTKHMLACCVVLYVNMCQVYVAYNQSGHSLSIWVIMPQVLEIHSKKVSCHKSKTPQTKRTSTSYVIHNNDDNARSRLVWRIICPKNHILNYKTISKFELDRHPLQWSHDNTFRKHMTISRCLLSRAFFSATLAHIQVGEADFTIRCRHA